MPPVYSGYDGGSFSGYGPIQGALPFGGGSGAGAGGAFAAAALPPAQAVPALAANYQGAYNSALAQNQSNYNNILAGYQKTLASQTTAQQAIQAGYSDLYNEVRDRLATQGQTRAADISAASTADLGRQTQGLIDRGLGNTTVQNSVVRGNQFDKQRQLTANSEAVSGLQASSARELGQAALGFQRQAAGDNSQLQLQQLNWMNSLSAPYPDAGLYGSLAAQAGQAGQQQRDAAYQNYLSEKAARATPGYAAPAPGGGPGPRLGYVPSATPGFGGGAYSAPAAYTGGAFGPAPTYGGPATVAGGGGIGGGSVIPAAASAYAGGANLTGWDMPALDYGGGGDFAGSGFDFGAAGSAYASGFSGGY